MWPSNQRCLDDQYTWMRWLTTGAGGGSPGELGEPAVGEDIPQSSLGGASRALFQRAVTAQRSDAQTLSLVPPPSPLWQKMSEPSQAPQQSKNSRDAKPLVRDEIPTTLLPVEQRNIDARSHPGKNTHEARQSPDAPTAGGGTGGRGGQRRRRRRRHRSAIEGHAGARAIASFAARCGAIVTRSNADALHCGAIPPEAEWCSAADRGATRAEAAAAARLARPTSLWQRPHHAHIHRRDNAPLHAPGAVPAA